MEGKMKIKQRTTWFISDTHFNHNSVIGFCDRPFKNIEEMNQTIIDNWNKVVKKEDVCIFVGDIFMYSNMEQMRNILGQMNGDRKILVKGNHDGKSSEMISAGFSCVVDELVMTIADEKVTVSHYPFRMKEMLFRWVKVKAYAKKLMRWMGIQTQPIYFEKYHDRRPVDRGQFLIHGHTHSKHKINGKAIHVGVDCRGYKPVNIQEISNEIQKIKRDGPVYIKYESNED